MTHRPSHWVERPWIDLVIGCGGWSAPLLLLAYRLIDSQAGLWAAVFYAVALVCNYPHYMATIHRAYARMEDRSAYRLFTHYVTGALVVVAAAAHVWPPLLPWLFTSYVMWSPWHYSGQNFGLSMMFLRRAGVDVSPRERQWLHVAFVASYVLLLAAFNQGPSRDPNVLSLALPDPIVWSLQVPAAIFFVGGSVLAFASLWRRAQRGSLVPVLTLWTTQALWFVVPVLVSHVSAAPSPQLSYSAGVLALMHSAQYLWITQHYTRRESTRIAGPSGWSRRRYWTILGLGGVALFIPAPWAASLIGHADFASSVLIVAAVVNIHHFILDGVVWKLRDPKVSQALVNLDAPVSQGARPPRRRPARWRLAFGAASIGLVSLALVDQFRYVLTIPGADAASLEIARTMNPRDSRVHLKLVKLLIDGDRLKDAYRENKALLEIRPTEADALINAGVLAQKLGDVDGAAYWWRRALHQAENRADVHLYLAELLDGAERPAEALPHYRRYLELIVDAHADRPDARRVALVVIKFGDSLARTGHADVAAGQYQLAEKIARSGGLGDVEALATERRASIGAGLGGSP